MSKRGRSVWDDVAGMGGVDTARVLMLLAQHQQQHYQRGVGAQAAAMATRGRVFECKTCGRQFPTFQALGGHRASHKRARLQHLPQQQQQPALGDEGAALRLGRRIPVTTLPAPAASRPRTHECPVCGMEFAVGQALGGHMRRHRAEAEAANGKQSTPEIAVASSCGAGGICLDLNLTPSENCAKCRSVAGRGGAAGLQGVDKALAILDCSL